MTGAIAERLGDLSARLLGGPHAKLRRAFEREARRAPPGPLQDFYAAGLPADRTLFTDLPLMAIDLETDGLNPARDGILEAGLVRLDARGVDPGSAIRVRFQAARALDPQAVVIHRITDDAAAAALDPRLALAAVLKAITGKVLVAHFSEIEARFLDAACRKYYGAGLVAPFICTMQLERRWFPRSFATSGLRLATLRARYGLPPYRAHDGVTDALACAELLLAQLAHASATAEPSLADVLAR